MSAGRILVAMLFLAAFPVLFLLVLALNAAEAKELALMAPEERAKVLWRMR